MDAKQNREVERLAAQAAKGKGYDWRSTPIYSTDGGVSDVVRDCLRMTGPISGRWQHFSERLDRVSPKHSSYGRDAAAREEDDSYRFSDYLPGPDEDLYGWLAELRIFVEATDERRPFFERIDAFINKHPVGTRGRALDDKKTLMELLEGLCSQPGGLLVRREAA